MGHRPDWNNTNFKKGAVRKFADGGEVEAREAAREATTFPLPEREPIVDTYEFGRYEEQEENRNRYMRDMAAEASKELEADTAAREADREMTPAPRKSLSFSEAFAENRKAGNKTFEWNGKQYTTEMAKPAAKPAARDYGDESARMLARNPAPKKPEPRKFMGRPIVETEAQRKASEAYKQANPFLRDNVKRGQGKDYK